MTALFTGNIKMTNTPLSPIQASFTRTLNPQTFREYMAELTCDSAEHTNVVHKYAAFQQLAEVFTTLVNSKYNTLAWLSVTRSLQYLVQAIDDYSEDDSYDWRELQLSNEICYLHYSVCEKKLQPFWVQGSLVNADDATNGTLLIADLTEFHAEHMAEHKLPTQFYIELCHNYVRVLLDYNAECGLTASGKHILSMLKLDETIDFPDLLPEQSTRTADGFDSEFDLDGSEVSEGDLFDDGDDEDDGANYEASLRGLLGASLPEAVIQTARKVLEHEHYNEADHPSELGVELAVQIIVQHLILSDSVRGCTEEEYVEQITDDIIDLEESISSEQNERLASLEARCHESFIVTLIEALRVIKCEPLRMYGFPEWRMVEICDGNRLPIYPEFYTNVANVLQTFLNVPASQIRMILDGESFSFSYMVRSEDMVVL